MPEEFQHVWFDKDDITDNEDDASEYLSESDGYSDNGDSDVQQVDPDASADDDEVEIHSDSTNLITSASTTAVNDDGLYRLLLKANAIFGRVRSMIRFLRNNGVVRNYIRSQQSPSTKGTVTKELVLDVRVRWNSSHRMLSRFLSHKETIKSIVVSAERIEGITKEQKTTLNSFRFDDDEWDVIESLRDILEPFVTATTILSTRNYSTAPVSLFICDKLSMFLQENLNDNVHLTNWKRSLRHQFHFYFDQRVEETQKHIMLVSHLLSSIK